MKTLKLLTLLVTLAVLVVSCSKPQSLKKALELNEEEQGPLQTTTASINTGAVTFCTERTIPLCWKTSGLNLGNITIKRGSDHKVYVTYKAAPTFYFQEINLFCGMADAIPSSLTNFPNRVSFASPYPVQEQTFTVNSLPGNFTVIAEAVVVKKASNGNITGDVKEGWGNGCTGIPICASHGNGNNNQCGDLSGGSMFMYSDPIDCFPPTPPAPVIISTPAVEPDICSYPICNYFATHATYGAIVAWAEPDVKVAGIAYTEAEGRAIANAPDANGVVADSKYAFLRVATLKLSYTNYAASPSLAPAVTTIETWLAGVGKLTPTNIPTGNAAVRAAADKINAFIDAHKCPDRME